MGSNTTNDASKYEHDQMPALAREPLVDQASSMLERAVRGTGGPALPSSLPFQGARGPHTQCSLRFAQCSLFAFDRPNAHGQQSVFGRRGDTGPNTQPWLGVGPHGYGSSDFFNFRVPRSALDRRPEPTPIASSLVKRHRPLLRHGMAPASAEPSPLQTENRLEGPGLDTAYEASTPIDPTPPIITMIKRVSSIGQSHMSLSECQHPLSFHMHLT